MLFRSAGVVNGLLYIVGGSNQSVGSFATVEAYNPVTDTWTPKASMPGGARSRLAVGVVNGILYAVGGSGSGGILTTVEAYDPVNNTWTTKAPMPTARENPAAGVVNGILYAMGGIIPATTTLLATVEAYTPPQ